MPSLHKLVQFVMLAASFWGVTILPGQRVQHTIDKASQLTKQRYTYPGYNIIINKATYSLSLYFRNRLVKTYACAIGKNTGDKKIEKDYRTPEGNFYVCSIENSKDWIHDFMRDGKGPVKDAYGPWFFRLYTGADSTNSGMSWKGFAIHGTHEPNSIGTNASEGCIRLRNEDILELKPFIRKGLPVRIEA